MINKTIFNSVLLIALILGAFSQADAQQLIKKTNKSWKIHKGVIGGVGLSNFLTNATPQSSEFLPEGSSDYSMLYAPRPEARIGLFAELESKCRFSFRLAGAYMMRAIPKPTFSAASSANTNDYRSIYLNGLMTDLTIFFRATDKFKVGVGFESAHFMMTKKLKEGDYADYANNYKFSHGVKAVVAYSISPRTELNMYVLASNNTYSFKQLNNISGGVAVAYRLCGKEIKVQKEVYKIDYTK